MPQGRKWLGLLTAFAVFSATAAVAQPLQFGDRTPLSVTRYGDPGGDPLLTANGSERFLFLATATSVRVARLADEHPVPRPVLDSTGGGSVAWDGENFLVVANGDSSVIGRLLDRNAEPLGEPFTIVEEATTPRVTSDGRHFVMLYESGGELRSVVVDRDTHAQVQVQPLGAAATDYAIASNGNGFAALAARQDGVHLLTVSAEGVVTADSILSPVVANAVALTSDGNEYLALWSHPGGIDSAEVSGGVAAASFPITATPAASLATVWSGAYEAIYRSGAELRRVTIDPLARNVGATTRIDLLGAADQRLVASASSPDGTLFLWEESKDVYVAVRTGSGAWRERLLTHDERAVTAQAGRSAFVVVTQNDAGWIAHLVAFDGTLITRTSRQPFHARTATAVGDAWVVIGEDSADVVASRIDRQFVAGESVVIRSGASEPAVAFDGTNLLVISRIANGSLEAVRLNQQLTSVDGTTILVTNSGATPSVMFNGTTYTLVWADQGFIKGRRIRMDGTVVGEFVQIGHGGANPTGVALTRLGSRTGLTWFDGNAQALVLDTWTVNTAKTYPAHAGQAPLLAMLPEGTIAFAHADSVNAAPYYGATRMQLAVGGTAAPAPRPDAPIARLALVEGKLQIEWSTPPRRVDTYRVEYRIDGGAWLEADGVIDGAAQSLTFSPWKNGTWAFRVRAFNDGGASAYSQVVEREYIASRRRAVR